MVSLNCNDLLLLASESELLCQGSEGIKEVVLFDAVVKWKTYHNFCAYADKLKSVYGVSKSHFHAGSTEIRIPSHSIDASSLFVMIRHLVSGIKL